MSRKSKREVLGVSKITYKFQVTIPKTVRERFGLKEGDIYVGRWKAGISEEHRIIINLFQIE